MGVEAPVSRHRKNNLKLYIVVCIVLAIWFGYDGYLNENFIQKHSVDTEADSILAFNQWSAPFQTRGFFVITYKTGDGGEVNLKLSDRNHDNLSALLDVLVAKIS